MPVFLVLSCLLVLCFSQPSNAGCIRVLGRKVCSEDVDPTRIIPGSDEIAGRSWGEAGSSGYKAAAEIMRQRNGIGQNLDDTQKRFLRQRYGGLVDRVTVAYGSSMMSEWCAAGKCVDLGGVASAAQTFCDRIYIGAPYKPNDTDQLILLAHELRHSEQCNERGGMGKFGYHYFREYKKAGQNYANNSMEKDAENTEKDFTKNVICVQVGCTTSVEHYPNYKGWGIDLPVSLVSTSSPSNQFDVGYFDNGATVFYSNGSSHCGFASPVHLRFYQKVNDARSLGRREPNNFGTYTGACSLPNGYFDNGATVFFSQGNGSFCGFPNPEAFESHKRSVPGQPSFGRIDIDPNSFMSYTGACQ